MMDAANRFRHCASDVPCDSMHCGAVGILRFARHWTRIAEPDLS
jgi:hypothetical protein